MIKFLVPVAAAALVCTSVAWAQSAPPAPPVAGQNAHRTYDQKVRECRKEAVAQGLSGEAARSFVADCAKR